jgi:NitT/TauT family transport system substrate-binding protein
VNLDVQLTPFDSDATTQQALAGGAIDVAAGAFVEPITLTAQGKPTLIFGAVSNGLPYSIMATREITTLDQLKGKVVGTSGPSGFVDIATRIVLNKNGIDPSSVKYQAAGFSNSRLAALVSGAIAATMLDAASVKHAEDEGMHSISNVLEELPGFPYEMLFAPKDYIDQHHGELVRFMQGYIQAAQYTTNPANRSDVIDILVDSTGLKAADLAVNYDTTIQNFPPTGAADLSAIQDALAGYASYADIPGIQAVKAEDLYFPSVQKEAASAMGLK